MGYVCKDCKFMDLEDIDKYGHAWCIEKNKYFPLGDITCREFDPKDTSNCYITTALCNILGYDDNCYIMNSLRNFRENYMKSNDEGKDLLEEYDTNGPIIASLLSNDPHKEYFAYEMLKSTILPCLILIKDNKNKEAMEKYKGMYFSLMEDLQNTSYFSNSVAKTRTKRMSSS